MDETVFMTMSEHKKLHLRLRKEGKCQVPVAQLTKISMAAHKRTQKGKLHDEEYFRNTIDEIEFTEHLMPCVRFHETLKYNNKTGHPTWTARFEATHGTKLFEVNI